MVTFRLLVNFTVRIAPFKAVRPAIVLGLTLLFASSLICVHYEAIVVNVNITCGVRTKDDLGNVKKRSVLMLSVQLSQYVLIALS